MNKVFTDNGRQDYVYWQTEDRKTLKKINRLLDDISRNGNSGIGKPEPLVGNLSGFWSRRIDGCVIIGQSLEGRINAGFSLILSIQQ